MKTRELTAKRHETKLDTLCNKPIRSISKRLSNLPMPFMPSAPRARTFFLKSSMAAILFDESGFQRRLSAGTPVYTQRAGGTRLSRFTAADVKLWYGSGDTVSLFSKFRCSKFNNVCLTKDNLAATRNCGAQEVVRHSTCLD